MSPTATSPFPLHEAEDGLWIFPADDYTTTNERIPAPQTLHQPATAPLPIGPLTFFGVRRIMLDMRTSLKLKKCQGAAMGLALVTAPLPKDDARIFMVAAAAPSDGA